MSAEAEHVPPASGRGTAVVTGGGRGIGAACCRRLAHDGYAVVVNYRTRAAPAEQLVAEITAAGGRALAVGADVGTEAGVAALFAAVDAAGLPPLTALVNNAGVLGPLGNDLDATSAEALSDVFNVNVLGPLLCCREAAKRMAPGSAIVNMSSGSASLGTPLLYSMSKGALNSMQGALVKPLAAKGIRMNAVSPGLTDTDMITEMVQGVDLAATVPMGRVGLPHEIADVVGFLLSPEAAYVHGANVRVAGGRGPGTFLG